MRSSPENHKRPPSPRMTLGKELEKTAELCNQELDRQLTFLKLLPDDMGLLGEKKRALLYWVKNLAEKIDRYRSLYLESWMKLLWARIIHNRSSGMDSTNSKQSKFPPLSAITRHQKNIQNLKNGLEKTVRQLQNERDRMQISYSHLATLKENRETQEQSIQAEASIQNIFKLILSQNPTVQAEQKKLGSLTLNRKPRTSGPAKSPSAQSYSQNPLQKIPEETLGYHSSLKNFDQLNLEDDLTAYERGKESFYEISGPSLLLP